MSFMKDLTQLNPKRILVCQLRQIGDVLLATPLIRLLNVRYPDAEIHVLTEKKCLPVLENNPRVSHIWPIDRKALRNPFKALCYYAKVGRQGYDLIVDCQQLPRCKWVVMFSDAPVKLTFKPSWYNSFLYTHWPERKSGYAAMCKAHTLSVLGIEWDNKPLEIWFTDEERQWALNYLDSIGIGETPFVTVDPSHRRITRKWPTRHFAGLIRLIRERYPDMRFIILYGPGEKGVADEVAELAGDGAMVPDQLLSLREMAAVQERAVLHLGNCSAPRHFAVAVGTPSLVVHGATGFGWRFPSDDHIAVRKDLKCFSCNKNECPTRECLEEFYPEDCIEDALKLLERSLRS